MLSNIPNTLYRTQKLYQTYDSEFTTAQLEIIDQLTAGVELTPLFHGTADQPLAQFKYRVIAQEASKDSQWLYQHMNSVITRANDLHWNMDLWGYTQIEYCEFAPGDYQNAVSSMAYKQTQEFNKLMIIVDLSYPPEYQGGHRDIANNYVWERIPGTRGRVTAYPSWCRTQISPIKEGLRRELRIYVQGPKFR